MRNLDECLNIEDMRAAAKSRLPKAIFEFIDRGVEDELALVNNRASLDRIKLLHRALVDISGRSMETVLFGRKSAAPIAFAPTGSAGLCWYQGELELAKAAAKLGVPYTLASGGMTSLETIAEQAGSKAGGQLWFQIYIWKKREFSYRLIERAREAGFEALVVTVDAPVLANREYNTRNGFMLPFHPTATFALDILRHPTWMVSVLLRYFLSVGMPRNENYPDELRHVSERQAADIMSGETLSWEDIRTVRKLWPGVLILKGLNRVDDAQKAMNYGVDGIVVSNHGGRNMDVSPAPIDILPRIADALNGKSTILFDSGIRRGSDIAKALALGADAVLIGRPPLYGMTIGGAAGAEKAVRLILSEFDKIMAYVGATTVQEISADILFSNLENAVDCASLPAYRSA